MLHNSVFDVLTPDEYEDLKSLYSLYEGEELQIYLKKFFNEPAVFFKIKSLNIDPMWVAREIFINGYRYGFKTKNQ